MDDSHRKSKDSSILEEKKSQKSKKVTKKSSAMDKYISDNEENKNEEDN